MHPELLNNSLFLKYYKQWQEDSSSIVFAPIAEYFLMYGMIDSAMKVCREGLKKHPNLVSGRIVMAKIHLKRGNWEEAESELQKVLTIAPQNRAAKDMIAKIDAFMGREHETSTDKLFQDASWQTVTMADIFASQGHNEKAREIYLSILSEDPENDAARKGIESLPVAG
ncbi:MAG: tetratricopeptide repeat protein [Pseudomonadota bacterium]